MSYADYTCEVLSRYQGGSHSYRTLLTNQLTDVSEALHLGCGRDLGGMLALFPKSIRVVGVDPDATALQEYPGEAYEADGAAMPFADESFDLVFSEYVLEHLAQPQAVFAEVARVLRPGGRFIALAPNFWSYKSLAAWLTPHRLHEIAVKTLRRDTARETKDVYPTVFQANSRQALQRLAQASGLQIESLRYIDNGPTWFQRMPGLFEIGRLYHTLLGWTVLQGLRCNIISVLRKPTTR